MMKNWIVAGFLAAALIGPVDAKPLSRIIAETGLSPEDFSMMSEASSQLVVNGQPVVGRRVSWSNPDSGSKGSVRLQAMRGECGYVQHITYPGGGDRPFEIRARLCRDANGDWILVP